MTEDDMKALEAMSKSTDNTSLKQAAETFEKDMGEGDEEASRTPKGERKFACPCCKGMIKMSVEAAE